MTRFYWPFRFKKKPRQDRIPNSRSRAHYLRWKERARVYIYQRVNFFNRKYRFSFNRIAIRNQRSLWGSCSSKRNLNFNYRLLFLPQQISDYIIVHELCHLQELNHSSKFWELVAQAIPEYKERKKRLRNIKVR